MKWKKHIGFLSKGILPLSASLLIYLFSGFYFGWHFIRGWRREGLEIADEESMISIYVKSWKFMIRTFTFIWLNGRLTFILGRIEQAQKYIRMQWRHYDKLFNVNGPIN